MPFVAYNHVPSANGLTTQAVERDLKGDMPDRRMIRQFDLIRLPKTEPALILDNPKKGDFFIHDVIKLQSESRIKRDGPL